MRGFIGGLSFLFIVFPLGMAALILISVSSWLMDRDFYMSVLGDERLYDAVLSESIPDVLFDMNIDGLQGVPSTVLSAGLREIITPDYLRTQATGIVDDVFRVFEGEQNIRPSFDLRPVKSALSGDSGQRFAVAIADNLPTCTQGQEPRASGAILPRCIPAGVSAGSIAEEIQASLPALSESLPDEFQSEMPINRGVPSSLENLSVQAIFQGVISLMTISAALVWFLTALIGGRGQRGRLTWLGWMLFIPALFTLLIGAVSLNGVLFSGNLGPEWFTSDQTTNAAFLEIIRSVFERAAGGFLLTGGISLVLSIFLMILAAMSPSRFSDDHMVTVPNMQKT